MHFIDSSGEKSANSIRVKKISQSLGIVHFELRMQWFARVHILVLSCQYYTQ